MLRGRRVLLAVTGGVAAYKTAYLARRLVEAEADVQVALSESALEFVGPQTFAAITGKQPHTTLFGQKTVSPHTELARWAEIIVVAPATAATIARIANGLSTDLISATLLTFTGQVLMAPAMHAEMWEHPATRRNIETLRADGYQLIGPESGALAGGDVGTGRVSEPEAILEAIERMLTPSDEVKRFLVTAGGTREPVDPVRFLGNRSSGKMGHSIANEAARRGMDVTLVTASDLPVLPAVKVVAVETAQEMLEAVSGVETDVAIMAAAVADFRPANPSEGKLPRSEGLDSIALEPNPDILASVVGRDPRPFVVGFAAETGDVDRAIDKAKKKKVDLLVYNDVSEPGSGFGTDTNRVVVIDGGGNTDAWPVMSKGEVAAQLIDRIMDGLKARG
ncbi:MAG TPA: bifunctional phosphopantothenoylcysteine decarboxylase/phosphopantothenate--cysteine ligase CoaBC [Acidimicrobiia bacterium]|nr:bifunctional phosphopantothenoylcysteine decarboxylase/phosphopantothenate--cysteine ligase CoaBC [Acidimicrobiia bacterium]